MTDWMADDSTTVALMDPPHQLDKPHHLERSHHLEKAVSRALRDRSDLRFSSLVIRRLENGVCLEGVVEVDEDGPDVNTLVRAIDGVDRVINRLVIRRRSLRKG